MITMVNYYVRQFFSRQERIQQKINTRSYPYIKLWNDINTSIRDSLNLYHLNIRIKSVWYSFILIQDSIHKYANVNLFSHFS